MEQSKEITFLKNQLLLHLEELSLEHTNVLTDEETLHFFHAKKVKATPISKPIAKQVTKPRPVFKPQTEEVPKPKELTPLKSPPKQKVHIETKKSEITQTKTDYFSIVQKVAPHIKLHQTPLSDEKAQRVLGSWKDKSLVPDVALLYFGTSPQEKAFLENVAFAIEKRFCPARVLNGTKIENGDKWDIVLETKNLKLILIVDGEMGVGEKMQKHLSTNPTTSTQNLGSKPLITIAKPAHYLNAPLQKQQLWKQLCHLLKQR